MYYTLYNSPIGEITLASDGESLTGLWNQDQKYHGNTLFAKMQRRDDLPIFDTTKNWLSSYFNGENPDISTLSLNPNASGGEFRRRVWKLLCNIPYGETVTYGYIAKQMGIKSGQAIGGAVGHNPISIIIPCHRVIGANRSLTGYAGGLKMKIALLELERVDMSKLTIPTKGTAI